MSSMNPNFRERSQWPVWLWLFLVFLAASLALAVWAALGDTGVRWGTITMLVQVLGLLFASQKSVLNIEVTDRVLHVGDANIEVKYINEITELGSEDMRQVRGPLADPAAYLALRFWVSTGVKITIADPKDPTPYWLISSKKAHSLKSALLNAKSQN